MKYIKKQRPPHELIAWTRARSGNEGSQQLGWNYGDMPSGVRQAVKTSLLQEQGGLDCYTGRRITSQSSHIEHLKPQRLCVDHEDTRYSNLLAAFPAPNAPKECEYGARARKSWFDERLFVHPLRSNCELRFRYKMNGNITPVNLADDGAKETIYRLCLDHKELKTMREQAIYVLLFEEKLSRSNVQRLVANIDKRDSDGLFRPFCFALKQACKKYLKRFE